jgi:hypothetical protein
MTRTWTSALMLALVCGHGYAARTGEIAARGGPAGAETALGRLTAAMQPGDMKELQTKNYTWDLVKSWHDNLDTLSLVDAEGKITPVAKSPAPVRCTSESKATVCPVSGDFLVQGRGMKTMVALHPVRNEWKTLSRGAPNGMAAPIPNYGVVMFCTGGRNPKVHIYMHKSPWTGDGTVAGE